MTKRPKKTEPLPSERSKYSFLAALCQEAVDGDFRNAGSMALLFVDVPDRAAELIKRLKRKKTVAPRDEIA